MTPESILIDSNVFIDLMKSGKDPIRHLLEQYDSTDLVTCGVVRAEVLRGIKSVKARANLNGFFSVMRFADLNSAAWLMTSDAHFDEIPELQVIRPEL